MLRNCAYWQCIIAEHLSASQLVLLKNSNLILRLHVCTSVTLRNANFLYVVCVGCMVRQPHSQAPLYAQGGPGDNAKRMKPHYNFGQQTQFTKTRDDGSICTMTRAMSNRTYQGWRRSYVGAIKGWHTLQRLWILLHNAPPTTRCLWATMVIVHA